MDAVRWQQIKAVLGQALEHEGDARRAFLNEACSGDSRLRREIDSLLAASSNRLDLFAEELSLAQNGNDSPVGRRIGAYEIVREIGRGGMGAVYLAVRADREFNKQVAIKLLKRGVDTDEVLRRFRGEREILARLEHPNIARLFDGGTTEDGLPYFVMEHVLGMPVTDYCRSHGLRIAERLQLFLKICSAVRFAHQNLVIHRDLKPANILVASDGEPKLLDFGIAKLIEAEAGTIALTVYHDQRLTPAYASPEQVRGETVTTVSDVYALGALLYEMVTGQNAHCFTSIHPSPTELLQVVAEQIPGRPSVVVSNPLTKRELRGDLDNIILKALAKEPDRRYGGVGALAEDIRSFQEKRPVKARKDTIAYRTSKLIERNKLAVGAGAIVLVTLVAALVATGMSAREAQRQRNRAQRRFDEVRRVANSLMLELHSAIKDLPGSLQARQLITRRAFEYLDSLAQEAGDDLSLKSELATAYTRLGSVTFDVSQALAAHAKAAALDEELARAAPNKLKYRQQLASAYASLSDLYKIAGNSTAAIHYAQAALAITDALAKSEGTPEVEAERVDRLLTLHAALSDAGHYEEALTAARDATALEDRLAASKPDAMEKLRELAEVHGTLSGAAQEAGEEAAARRESEQALTLAQRAAAFDATNARNQRDLWSAELRAGEQLARAAEAEKARAALTKAREIMERLSAADPADIGHRHWLAATYLAIGEFHASNKEPEQAIDFLQKGIHIDEELLAHDDERVETHRDLAKLYQALARVYLQGGQGGLALEKANRAEALAETSLAKDQENLRVRARLAAIKQLRDQINTQLGPEPHPSN